MPPAYRLAPLSRAIREAFPDAGAPLYEAVTTLGDPTFLTFALAILYWLHAERRGETAAVVTYGFIAFGVIYGLKTGLALPRPPESVWLIETDGFGFPSGHAVAAVVIYGGLALEYDWSYDDPRFAAAMLLVVAIALSRVVVGVHYLGDILVGGLVGLGVLLAGRAFVGHDLTLGFGIGVVTAVPGIVVTGGGGTALGIAGACLGGLLGSRYFEDVPRSLSRVEAALLVAVGVVTLVVVQVLKDGLATIPLGPAIDDAIVVAFILLLPVALRQTGLHERLAAGS
jgi:membrane-associated phospholipid phosphatase